MKVNFSAWSVSYLPPEGPADCGAEFQGMFPKQRGPSPSFLLLDGLRWTGVQPPQQMSQVLLCFWGHPKPLKAELQGLKKTRKDMENQERYIHFFLKLLDVTAAQNMGILPDFGKFDLGPNV